jgi:hypothetical protein
MRRNLFAFVLVLLLCVPMAAVAQGGFGGGETMPTPEDPVVTGDEPTEDSDRPDWGGPEGDHDLTPGRQNDEPGIAMGDLYGDLYVIVRNDNGEPLPYTWVWSEDGLTPLYPVATPAEEIGFWQPIAISDEEATALGLDPLPAEFLGLVPLDVEGLVPEAYAEYTQEVDFGRLNLVRAPSEFLDLAYEEAIGALNAAGSVTLDPAGRLLLTTGDESKAIDSPRENLAMYRELMLNGYLPGLTREDLSADLIHLRQGQAEEWVHTDLDRAASFLSAAADKGGFISVDKVVYINTFMGINALPEYFDFVTFGGSGYGYQRGGSGGAYTDVTAALLQGPISYAPDTFVVDDHVSIMRQVFNGEGYGPGSLGAAEFAKAADDALKVITYIHNWAVPEY